MNDENRETAQALKRTYHESTQKPAKATATKKKGQLSDFGSTRGSEERNGSMPTTSRGQKRGRNADIEDVSSPLLMYKPATPHLNQLWMVELQPRGRLPLITP